MNPKPHNGRQQQQTSPAWEAPTQGVRVPNSKLTEELQDVAPAFRLLHKAAPADLKTVSWKEFTNDLNRRLDAELQQGTRNHRLRTLRDKFRATDSKVVRALGYLIILLIVAAIAVGIYFVSLVAVPEPTYAQALPRPAEFYAHAAPAQDIWTIQA